MIRRTALLIAAVLVASTALPLTSPAEAGRRGDALSNAAKTHRKAFKRAAKQAESAFAGVVSQLTKSVAGETVTTEDAVTDFGNALSFYASTLHAAAADAAEAFAGDAVTEMSANGDPSLQGAAAGDGGSLDSFSDAIRGDLVKFRAKALKRAGQFQKAMARSDGQRGGVRVSLEGWTFTPRPAPDSGGALPIIPEPLRLWGSVATRLSDGRIIVTAFGSAAPQRDNEFDVRIARGVVVKPIGEFLSGGGMDVNGDGWWSQTGAVNNPFVGDTVAAGNAQIHFGVDPDDSDQPARLEHGGLLSIP